MLKAENMSNMVNVIDGIASSPSIPAKVNGDKFLQYWYTQFDKNPFIRSVFDKMTPEEMQQQYGPDNGSVEEAPNTGDEVQGKEEVEGSKSPSPKKAEQEGQEVPQQKQEVEQVVKQTPNQEAGSKEEQIIRNTFQ